MIGTSAMRVGLFIPCYIDQLYPRVGMATVEVLEHFGVEEVRNAGPRDALHNFRRQENTHALVFVSRIAILKSNFRINKFAFGSN